MIKRIALETLRGPAVFNHNQVATESASQDPQGHIRVISVHISDTQTSQNYACNTCTTTQPNTQQRIHSSAQSPYPPTPHSTNLQFFQPFDKISDKQNKKLSSPTTTTHCDIKGEGIPVILDAREHDSVVEYQQQRDPIMNISSNVSSS